MNAPDLRVAVLIPYRDEETTVGGVAAGFRAVFPEATVYDNGSVDQTVTRSLEAGAVVGFEPALGKGHVVCRMFADVEAGVYVMADGDET